MRVGILRHGPDLSRYVGEILQTWGLTLYDFVDADGDESMVLRRGGPGLAISSEDQDYSADEIEQAKAERKARKIPPPEPPAAPETVRPEPYVPEDGHQWLEASHERGEDLRRTSPARGKDAPIAEG